MPLCQRCPIPAVLPLARVGDGLGARRTRGSRQPLSRNPAPAELRTTRGASAALAALPGVGTAPCDGDPRGADGRGSQHSPGVLRRSRVRSPAGAGSSRWDGGSSPAPRQVDTRFQPGEDTGTAPRPALGAHRPHRSRRRPLARGSAKDRSWHGRGPRAPAPARRRGGDSPRAPCPALAGRGAICGSVPARPPRAAGSPPSAAGAAPRGVAALLRPRRGRGGREFRRPLRGQTTLRGAAAAGAGCGRRGRPGGLSRSRDGAFVC